MTPRRLLPAVALVALAGCAPAGSAPGATAGPATTAAAGHLPVDDPHAPMPAPGTCHIGQRNGQPLPDPTCTPGAVNAAVTQATIGQTICSTAKGPDGKTWNQEQRPPLSKTEPAKRAIAAAYGVTLHAGQDELDHDVPISLGGAPFDPRNFWIEPGAIPNIKDKVEWWLLDQVCHHGMPLAQAQIGIATSWTEYLPQATSTAPMNDEEN